MDIKLKNKKLTLGCFFLALYMLSLSVVALNSFQNDKQFLKAEPYFKSTTFKDQIDNFLSLFVEYNIDNKGYLKKSIDEKIDKEELKSLKSEYEDNVTRKLEDVENEYSQQIEEAENNGNKDKLTRLTEERNRKLEEVRKQNAKTEEDFKKELVEKSDNNYNNLKKQFESRNDIRYYFKDIASGDVYTNLANIDNLQEYIKNNALYSISLPQKSSIDNFIYNHGFMDLDFEGYIIVPYGGTHLSLYKDYNQGRSKAIIELLVLVLSLALGIFLMKLARKNNIEEQELLISVKRLNNKLPFDIKFIAFALSLLFIPTFLTDGTLFWGMQIQFGIIFTLTLKVLLIFYFYISLPEIIESIKNKDKLKALLNSSLIYRLKSIADKSFKDKNLLFKSFVVLVGLIILSLITLIIFMNQSEGDMALLFIVIYIVTVIAYIFVEIISLDKIIKGTNEIVSGNLNYVIKETGKGNFAKLAHNINNMKSGISKAVENQMKSDRLKSELITNVSHDLKTPLTSIINYVDLLKREDLTKEDIQDYIGVLDRKTQRLKVLIEDLFEASKMAAGTVELNIEKVDVAQLLNQALAEFDEKIKTSSLTFRVNIPHQKIYANLDGKKTWRVFENLIGNILKYSQPGTRVYIELMENENNIVITMKNISAYEMDFNVDEIFERFKRGDSSRSTEGSGLGLAIAKSIVDLQNGKLTIDIDGDLFKAMVEFKK